MAIEVIWTKNALADYEQVVDYLLSEWPLSVAADFIANLEARVQSLSSFPEIGIASFKEPGIRSIGLTKHNRLYYKFADNKLTILNIFDTRQNPAKNKYD